MSEVELEPEVEAEETPGEPVEAEEIPGEPEPSPEPQEEPEAAEAPAQEGRTPEEYERLRKKLDQSATTWRNRVADLLGEDALHLQPCPLCADDIPGHIWPPEWQKPTSELHARLLDVLKQPAALPLREAPNVRECGVCGGLGKVKSGSKVPTHEDVTCPQCRGFGYDPPPGGRGKFEGGNGQVELPTAAGEAPLVTADVDAWGHPRMLDTGAENPNYGKMPQYVDPRYP